MAELNERMDSAELTEWVAYADLEPFGPEWENWRAGLIAATTANCHRGKGQKAFQAKDFMPGQKEEKKSWQQIKAAFSAAFRNGKWLKSST